MDLTKAIELFEEIKKRVQNHQSYFSEFRTRILLIDPVLRLLGWDVENPDLVELEYQPAKRKRKSADYVLKNDKKNVAIVEAKNVDKKIDDLDHREQADGYARYAEVKFFVLTNGIRWLLYERDLMTSLESLKPIVSFNVVHDKPYQCALAAISMWGPNLASDGGPSKVTVPVLISPNPVQDQPSNQFDEQPEQQLPDASLEDSDCWCSFEDKIYPPDTKPVKLKIGNNPAITVKHWNEAMHKVAAWLADEEILSVNDCPIGGRKYTFIGREAVNPDGTPFTNPQQLPNGLILQRDYLNTEGQWDKLRQLLNQPEKQRRVNPSQIQMFYKAVQKAKR